MNRRVDLPTSSDKITPTIPRDASEVRTRIFERMAALIPEWTERHVADLGVTVVDILAEATDRLSYLQDAVATEAFLTSARRRISMRRHGRILDARLHEGNGARVWVQIDPGPDLPAGTRLPVGTQVMTRVAGLPSVLAPGSVEVFRAHEAGAVTYETLEDFVVDPRRATIQARGPGPAFAEYGTVPAGATTLVLEGGGCLAAGDTILIDPRRDAEDVPVGAGQQQVVRLTDQPQRIDTSGDLWRVRWSSTDALAFDFAFGRSDDGTNRGQVRANLIMADQGRTIEEVLPEVPDDRAYLPRLDRTGLVFHEPLGASWRRAPAAEAYRQRATAALPRIRLWQDARRIGGQLVLLGDRGTTWRPRLDLLRAGEDERAFVAEVAEDGRVQLRFGDGRFGRRPSAGSRFRATYRVADGSRGSLGPDVLFHVVTTGWAGTSVRNPIASSTPRRAEDAESFRWLAAQPETTDGSRGSGS